MLYNEVVGAYQELASTTSRLRMSNILVALLRATPLDLLPRLVYLTQGRLYPEFAAIEIGMAERLVLRAVAAAAGDRRRRCKRTSPNAVILARPPSTCSRESMMPRR